MIRPVIRAVSGPVWLIGDVPLAIASDAPTIWLVDLGDAAARARAEAIALLPGEAAAVARRHDAEKRLLRRRLARLLLGAAAECRADEVVIGRTDAGAPVVLHPAGWHLSLAARWPWCAIGVAGHALGVDVEATGEPLSDDLLTVAERAAAIATSTASGDDEGRTAARCWAAKEAHAKWTGRPRNLDPAAIETGRPPLVTSSFGATRSWTRDLPGHVAAVCIV